MNSIVSHIISFIIGITTGVLGSFIASRLSDKAKKKDDYKDRRKEFKSLVAKMPNLVEEMKNDLSNPEMYGCKEFFISPSKNVVFNIRTPVFFYYEDEHDNLLSKIRMLENAEFVFDITPGNSPKYQFTEEFLDLLNEMK
jgi:hypothetical protein